MIIRKIIMRFKNYKIKIELKKISKIKYNHSYFFYQNNKKDINPNTKIIILLI